MNWKTVFLIGIGTGTLCSAGVVTKEITYSDGKTEMKGLLAWDDAVEGKRPGVLVVHEWWGQNKYARSRARKLANLGYAALAVDMYGEGKLAEHPKDAGVFSSAVMDNMEEAKGRFLAAKKTLAEEEVTDGDRMAAIGYCFGGGVVLHMARMGVDLDAVVSFHGSLGSKVVAEPGSIRAKILVCNGADDTFVPEETIEAFKQEMKAAEADMRFKNYPGAVHSFTNVDATRIGKKFEIPLAYNRKADKASWGEMKKLFSQVLD